MAPRKIHFNVPEEAVNDLKDRSSAQMWVAARSITMTTCSALDEDAYSVCDEDDERLDLSVGSQPLKCSRFNSTVQFILDPRHDACQIPLGDTSIEPSSLPNVYANFVVPAYNCADEDQQALVLESYLYTLLRRQLGLSHTAMMTLRHDLELLNLSDLHQLLGTLFKMLDVLKCHNLKDVFNEPSFLDVMKSDTVNMAVRGVIQDLLDAAQEESLREESICSQLILDSTTTPCCSSGGERSITLQH
eukprot:Blabericola_migrator_1__2195@NODE_1605_length_4184_cov_98_733787_g359_i1_p3_GENE_NODE_1605_length_4184_cov_98_733787_g359_i1NODE_1605_length_4184_cov_98_733787_g359_i1_p3_ORF_typecomplete_len246_score44_76_NODE_1605_length_4184_cov_98_733787_g359_i111311868